MKFCDGRDRIKQFFQNYKFQWLKSILKVIFPDTLHGFSEILHSKLIIAKKKILIHSLVFPQSELRFVTDGTQ